MTVNTEPHHETFATDAELDDIYKGASVLLPLFKVAQEISNNPEAVLILERLATMHLPSMLATNPQSKGKRNSINLKILPDC